MKVGEGVWLAAVANARGLGFPVSSSPVYLAFSLHNNRWRCLEGCEIVFLVNGRRLPLGLADNLDREIGGAYGVIERIGVIVSYETLREMLLPTPWNFRLARMKQHSMENT